MEDKILLEKNYTIKDLPLSERPREKLYSYGAESLSNAELLAIIIRTGHKEDTAIDLSQRILTLDKKGLAYLTNVTVEQLTQIKGIGKCKAAQILAAIELGKRISRWRAEDKIKINSPLTVANLVMDEMRFLDREHFNVVLLDTKNQLLSIENISIGTLNASIVHPRDVFRVAIKKNSNAIILLHNHPSGDPEPSNEDIRITERLVEVGNLVGIKVLDHIIIGDNRYVSFKEKNLL